MRNLDTYSFRENPLSTGNNAVVYRARDSERRVEVILKIFYDAQVECGRAEAQLIKDLNKIGWEPKLLDEIQTERTPQKSRNRTMYCFSLEYLQGIDGCAAFQPQRLPKYRPERVGAALTASIDLAADIEELHRMRIIHNDVKPGNILLLPDGCYRLIDFGLAFRKKEYGPTPHIGTLGYAAPEQIEVADRSKIKPVCEQTDQWGIGSTLYTLLTGRRLIRCSMSEVIPLIQGGFSGEELTTAIEGLLIEKTLSFDAETLSAKDSPICRLPIDWSSREGILRIVKRCLRQDPADRYPTTAELCEDLRIALHIFERKHDQVDHRPNSKPYGEEYYKFMRRELRRKAREKAKSQ